MISIWIAGCLKQKKWNLAERMEPAVYLGLDEKNITVKYVAGVTILT